MPKRTEKKRALRQRESEDKRKLVRGWDSQGMPSSDIMARLGITKQQLAAYRAHNTMEDHRAWFEEHPEVKALMEMPPVEELELDFGI